MFDLHILLDQYLEQLSSPRSSHAAILTALNSLERVLARATTDEAYKHAFLSLQLTFQYNCASRILPFLAHSTLSLQHLTNHGVIDPCNYEQIEAITSNFYLALSLVQGLALNHTETKIFLGKTHSLHTLLDLLLASRHLPVSKPSSSSSTPHITSCVLDTLLCILVDLPQSLRTFEGSNGLQAVVKILKRAGTPREVRMKCLEFLYFYLLDETTGINPPKHRRTVSSVTSSSTPSLSSSPSMASTTPSPRTPQYPPQCPSTPFPSRTPRVFTPISKSGIFQDPETPARKSYGTPAHLLILNRPVDFVPVSPKKPRMVEHDDTLFSDFDVKLDLDDESITDNVSLEKRTTEEKKEMLGRLLGNVDALVEGVRKAGVWGLG